MEEDKRGYIVRRVKLDVLSVDMQWSLFVSALNSYRKDSALRPFPPMFSSGVEKDYDTLLSLTKQIPTWDAVLSGALNRCTDDFVDLLHWVIQAKNFALQACPNEQYEMIQALTKQVMPVSGPDYIMEVVYSREKNEKFTQLQGNRELLYGYHGSRLDNFHSIIHNGLHSHLNKTSLFGEGTYLSSELSVSMPFAPPGAGWNESWIGTQMSCIAVCEFIDDPVSVKCQIKEKDEDKKQASSRAQAPGSMAGEVPEKYYIVRNNELIRVKYILIYVTAKPHRKSPVTNSSRLAWLMSHKFAVAMIFYALLLLFIGLCNSRHFQNLLRKYTR